MSLDHRTVEPQDHDILRAHHVVAHRGRRDEHEVFLAQIAAHIPARAGKQSLMKSLQGTVHDLLPQLCDRFHRLLLTPQGCARRCARR